MSIHQSLKAGDGTARGRNVLTRWERVQLLREQERWKDGDKVYGLPKVRTLKVKIGGKKKKKAKEEEGEGTEAAAAPAAETK